jgi:exodeoxyribonuclease-3
MLRISSWNINSVRLRKELIKKVLLDHKIDILCLQETKTNDENFPEKFFLELGYKGVYYNGEKSYNGVCIISKLPLKNVEKIDFVNDHKRHISADIETSNGRVKLHNFYIPAGGDEPDVNINPKFAHKIDYLKELQEYFSESNRQQNNIILGDFNIAPYEHDVWSHKQLLKVVSHTPIEVENLDKLKELGNFVDLSREFVPKSEKLYSWWSYRNRDWRKSNRGRRLDHIWASKNISSSAKKLIIDEDVRDWEKTSDHVPVIVDFDL